jgi:hypothetical protein
MILYDANMKIYNFKIIIILLILLFIISVFPSTYCIEIENNNIEYEYYTYLQMTDLLQDLQSQNPNIIKVESYGKTHENRDIWFVKISDNVEINEDEPGILLLGAHHGDEKISYEIIIFFIKYMIENYEKENMDDDNDGIINEDPIDGKDNDQDSKIDEDPSENRVRQAIDNTQIYLIPMINPDGVESNSRKNCNPDSLHGVNTNRNFGYDWKYYELFPGLFGDFWASQNTSGNYRGIGPYSEIESQAVKRVAESYTINISLSYHSGAEVVFYPWYHTTVKTPHEELFIEIGEEMGEISGYPLWTGKNSLIPRLGGTLGTSENFLYGEHKILAYTVESYRHKAPKNPENVNYTCFKNVGVHLYLCEKAQTIDNNKISISRNQGIFLTSVFNLLNKLFQSSIY